MKKTYLRALGELKTFAHSLPTTRFRALAKIDALILLNTRYERVMVDRASPEPPDFVVERLITDSHAVPRAWADVSFIADQNAELGDGRPTGLEQRHHDLSQKLWTQFAREEHQACIVRYQTRLRLNGLSGAFLCGSRCIDVGRGYGNFAHAFVREGAA